jgi:GNAT superfamily N-acetyltransferase
MNRTQVRAEAWEVKSAEGRGVRSAEGRGVRSAEGRAVRSVDAGDSKFAEVRESESGRVEIRLARSGDRDAIREFLGGLSLRSRYLRFFTGAAPGSPSLLGVLTGNRDNIDAVVATEHGMIIGHAMAADMADPGGAHVAEIGVVVADARQGRGVGSALVRAVIDRAQSRGATTVAMEVLAENRQVLTMITKHWPIAYHTHSGVYVTIRAVMPEDLRADVPGSVRAEVPGNVGADVPGNVRAEVPGSFLRAH